MKFNIRDTVKVLDCSQEGWFNPESMGYSIGRSFKILSYDSYDNTYLLENNYWYPEDFLQLIDKGNDEQSCSELTVQSSIDFLISQGYTVSLSKN